MRISETIESSRVVSDVALELLRAKGFRSHAAVVAEARGASSRVVQNLKSAIGAGSSDGSSWAADIVDNASRDAFFASLRNDGAFFYALANGARQLPFRTPLAATTLAATAWIQRKAKPAPLTKLGLSGGMMLEAEQATAIMVLTSNLLEGLKPEARAFVDEELRGAVVTTVDAEFLANLRDSGTTVIESSGPDVDGANADLYALFAAIPAHKRARLLLVASADVAHGACFLRDAAGYLFPEMTVAGGLIRGVECVVSDAAAAGEMWLLDLSQIAVGVGDLRLSASGQVSIEMLDAALVQDAGAGTPTSLVSMFQTDCVALLASIEFGAMRLRETACAIVDQIAWGVSGS